jgi:nitrate reductase molybdenum cofactor assembly chaperone NarJ/NarW
MAEIFKALSALLTYPTAELQAATSAIGDVLDREPAVRAVNRALLHDLVEEIATGDLYDLQERYVVLFDRSRPLSLHLFEHVHGESRDRGQAMIDLQNLYENGGLVIDAAELPDFLPLFLEFLSTRPLEESRDLLGQTAHILAAIGERLVKRDSPYAAVFTALVDIAGGAGKGETAMALAAEPDTDPSDLAALDAAWEETPVVFGPEAAPGCKDGLIARLRAARRPAERAQ